MCLEECKHLGELTNWQIIARISQFRGNDDYEAPDDKIEVFRDTLGYDYIYAPDLTRDYSNPLHMDELFPALQRINPSLPEAAINEVIYKLQNFEGGSFQQKNVDFMKYLQKAHSTEY